MDILDIMLARALTPQGQTEAYVSIANAAAEKAEKAKQDAAEAIATVEAAADEIAATQEEASDLLEAAQEALTTAQAAQINTLDIEDVDEEIKKMKVTRSQVTTNASEYYENLHVTYPDGTGYVLPGTVMLQKKTGLSEVAGMTQKAITEALATKASTSDLAAKADKTYVDSKIASIPSGGNSGSSGTTNLGPENAGNIVVIGPDGNIIASGTSEQSIIEALIKSGTYISQGTVGLEIDYENKSFTRTQEAANKTMGADFNIYSMYGGRVKCNVLDNGTITAFYGDNNYTEDGSNGQVMIYQPKFYYKRTPYKVQAARKGQIIRHESLILSATQQFGFKLAPAFAGELDYILLPAYDGFVQNDKLCSIAGVLPTTNISIEQAESYATARGEGWHIMNMAAQCTNQMLEIVEFGMMNGQTALGQGITQNPNSNGTCFFITGSTAELGNNSGIANETRVSINNNITVPTGTGYKAISYRGMENPWGNLWQMIGGINIYGNGSTNGGSPYICTDYNYTPDSIGNNYEEVGFYLPSSYKWINAMGFGNEKYDWVFLPIECSNSATSLLPVGDSIWTVNGLNGLNVLVFGGSYGFGDECGPFYYGADRTADNTALPKYNAKLMYIPTKNSVYNANIAKWTAHVGG